MAWPARESVPLHYHSWRHRRVRGVLDPDLKRDRSRANLLQPQTADPDDDEALRPTVKRGMSHHGAFMTEIGKETLNSDGAQGWSTGSACNHQPGPSAYAAATARTAPFRRPRSCWTGPRFSGLRACATRPRPRCGLGRHTIGHQDGSRTGACHLALVAWSLAAMPEQAGDPVSVDAAQAFARRGRIACLQWRICELPGNHNRNEYRRITLPDVDAATRFRPHS
jgi:hypothetical protein